MQPAFREDPQSPKRDSKRRKSIAFVGSYEESLLNRRMSSSSSNPVTFNARLGAIGKHQECPAHVATSFEAVYYDWDNHDRGPANTPYVGNIEVNQLVQRGRGDYRIPRHGQLQIIISNMENTPVHIFLIPYDLNDMPKQSKTFLRYRSYETTQINQETSTRLTHVAHIPIICRRNSKIYITGELRLVFPDKHGSFAASNTRVEVVNGGFNSISQTS